MFIITKTAEKLRKTVKRAKKNVKKQKASIWMPKVIFAMRNKELTVKVKK